MSEQQKQQMHIRTKGEDGAEVDTTLTYEGATPDDPGPAGAVVRMLIAQLKGDEQTFARSVTKASLEMQRAPVAGAAEMGVKVGQVTPETDDRAVVPAEMSVGGQGQEIPAVVVKEEGEWRVDMVETINRLMGSMMGQLGEQMGQAMQAVGEAMAQGLEGAMTGLGNAMGGGGAGDEETGRESTDESMGVPAEMPSSDGDAQFYNDPRDFAPDHPHLIEFREKVRHLTGVRWFVQADWTTFPDGDATGLLDGPEEDVLRNVLGDIYRVVKQKAKDGKFIEQCSRLDGIELRRSGHKSLDLDYRTIRYHLGEKEDGTTDYLSRKELGPELRKTLKMLPARTEIEQA